MTWKKLGCNKKKGSRLSRIVSDLQQPKIADSSLVVATGFPTSLVDLFVKNRARLRKPRNEKVSNSRPDKDQEDDLVISDPVVVSCSRDVGLGGNGEEEVKVESLGYEEVKVESLSEDGVLVEGHCGDSGKKVGFGGLFWVVLVLGFGLSIKNMVVGVTLSAFALIMLDCCCGRWLRLLLEPRLGLVSRVLGLVWWVGREKEKEEQEEEGGDGVVELRRDGDGDGLVSDGEIQFVECHKEERELELALELELEFAEWEESVVEECEKVKSKGGKIRRKIVKNLVPKKLRARAKKRKMKRKEKELELENEAFDCPGHSRGKSDSQNYEGDVEDGEESSRNGSISEDGRGIGRCSFNQDSQPDKGITLPFDEEVRVPVDESKLNYGYGIVLLVLAGLVGGRIAAFLLTVGLCLVLKLVKKWRRPMLIDH